MERTPSEIGEYKINQFLLKHHDYTTAKLNNTDHLIPKVKLTCMQNSELKYNSYQYNINTGQLESYTTSLDKYTDVGRPTIVNCDKATSEEQCSNAKCSATTFSFADSSSTCFWDTNTSTCCCTSDSKKCPVPSPSPSPGPGPSDEPKINQPANKRGEYVFLSYYCPGYDGKTGKYTGFCSKDQITHSKINWLFIGMGMIDWSVGTIDMESIIKGPCMQSSSKHFSTQFLEHLHTVHEKGITLSLSLGGQDGTTFPLTNPSTDVINKMVSSFKILRKTIPFDGIDFDFETGGTACLPAINIIAMAFKKAGYIVSGAPTASQLKPGYSAQLPNVYAGINLEYFDAIMPQWYEGNCSTTNGEGLHPVKGTGSTKLIGNCPVAGSNWLEGTEHQGSTYDSGCTAPGGSCAGAKDFMNLWQKFGAPCEQGEVNCKDSDKCWRPDAAYGPCIKKDDGKDDGKCSLVFDTSNNMNKYIIGLKTWGGYNDCGVVKIDDIISLIKAYPNIGGVGTWAIYHQCGTGDNGAAANFAKAIGASDLFGYSWYADLGLKLAALK
jgi:hypothetical protein